MFICILMEKKESIFSVVKEIVWLVIMNRECVQKHDVEANLSLV